MRQNTVNAVTVRNIHTPVVGMMVLCTQKIPVFKLNDIYTIHSKTVDEEDDLVFIIKVDAQEKIIYPDVLMENFMEVLNDNSSPTTNDIGEELSSLIAEAKKKHTNAYADVERANRRIKAVEELLSGLGLKEDVLVSNGDFSTHRCHIRYFVNDSDTTPKGLNAATSNTKFKFRNVCSLSAADRVLISNHLEAFVKEVMSKIK